MVVGLAGLDEEVQLGRGLENHRLPLPLSDLKRILYLDSMIRFVHSPIILGPRYADVLGTTIGTLMLNQLTVAVYHLQQTQPQ